MDSAEVLLSIIIPVHNGEKFIRKTVEGILRQTYPFIEVILIENASKDNSLEICKELSNKDSRVITLQSLEKGTSLARKMGVIEAKGEYIVFSDQDDSYNTKTSLEKMVKAIVDDQVQICQFGYYKKYFIGIKKRIGKGNRKYTRNEITSKEIMGVLGKSGSNFSTTVWSKIYDAKMLKSAVSNINETLYFAEDEYLNLLAFLNKDTLSVSSRDEAYYVWNVGTGFSSSKGAGDILFSEYECIKPVIINLLEDNNCPSEILWQFHLETIYFQKSIVQNMIRNKVDKSQCIIKIEQLMNYKIVKMAKEYFVKENDKKLWPELKFLASQYTPTEYYYYCCSNQPKWPVKTRFINVLRKLKL